MKTDLNTAADFISNWEAIILYAALMCYCLYVAEYLLYTTTLKCKSFT